MFEYEAGVIRRLIRDRARIIYRHHAERERMVQREITDNDVRTILGKCRVTDVRETKLGPVWSAEGTDLDGRNLRICVSVPKTETAIIVVTTINLDARD